MRVNSGGHQSNGETSYVYEDLSVVDRNTALVEHVDIVDIVILNNLLVLPISLP